MIRSNKFVIRVALIIFWWLKMSEDKKKLIDMRKNQLGSLK